MIGMNKGIIPLESAIDNLNYDKEIDDFIKMEKSLIYVSMTRARDVLYILSSSLLSEYI
jgi:superfamily I DNA/RNA helicase